jgi:hypothetical protein
MHSSLDEHLYEINYTVASNKFWSSMSFQNLVIWFDYAHVNKVSKNENKMTINVIQHDDRL